MLGGRHRWTQLDRDKAIAYARLLREQCPNCGTLPEDWFTESGRPREDPVWAPVERWCPGDAEIERFKKRAKTNEKPGAYITLIPFSELGDAE